MDVVLVYFLNILY